VKAVLDTNILIRAHKSSKGQARRLLIRLVERGQRLVISNPMIVEVTRLLRYPRFQSIYGLTEADLLEYAQFLQSIADIVLIAGAYSAPLRDPSDLVVMQTAERGRVDVLCSNDLDFHEPGMVAFCAAREIEVCDEATLLARLSTLAS
jgi:putative PIN family toxin of toxin-antitoxin system